jgi:hypothetical protein
VDHGKGYKKHWFSVSQQERKKFKVAIHMVEDVDLESLLLNDCHDDSFHDERFKQSDICNIVHGDEICVVLPFMHLSMNECECELYGDE